MFFRKKPSGLDRAATALATAGGVAHAAFFALFAWRVVSGGFLMKWFNVAFSVCALVGMVLNFVGWALLRNGALKPVRKIGMTAIALSTGLAALLLAVASWTGG